MKAFKFLLIFFVVTVAILGMVIGLNWTAFKVVFSDPETFSEGSEWIETTYSLAGLVEYIEANPQHVSMVSLNLNNPDDSLLYNEHEPRVMGALANIFLLMEFERQYEAGTLNPDTKINRDEIDAFVVPSWYENAHRNAMRRLDINNNQVRLGDLLRIVTQHNSQAASDWLFFYLGPENVNALIDSVGQGRIEPWMPGSGIQIATTMRSDDLSIREAVDRLRELPADERAAYFNEAALRYINNEPFREEVRSRARPIRERLLADERAIHGLFSRAEPLRLTEIMAMIYQGEFLNEEVGERIFNLFAWAYEDPVVQQHASDYFALFDSRLSYLTGMDAGTSAYTGDSFAQTLFFDDLPVAFYMHMSSNYMNQDLQRRLIYDPELRRISRLASENQLTPNN
ncbi:MAG: class A beta-lactamase-related serine hydrolase [Balneolia bacterium]|nr:class A beta-lactamase-related serine hydrolase [Balneolia bacterium]